MRFKKVNVRESLRSSFKDGIFAAFMAGVTDYYATPAALFFGATVQQVGLITALPNLLSSLSQFFSVRVIYWVGGRLKLLVRLVFSQASFILCIAVLPLLEIAYRVELLLIFLILAAVCGGLAGPAWGSLMSDYVPAKKRGRYFAWRSRTVGTVTVGSIVTSADIKAVAEMKPPAPGTSRVDGLKGSEYLRVWINKGGTHYLINLGAQ